MNIFVNPTTLTLLVTTFAIFSPSYMHFSTGCIHFLPHLLHFHLIMRTIFSPFPEYVYGASSSCAPYVMGKPIFCGFDLPRTASSSQLLDYLIYLRQSGWRDWVASCFKPS